ncbi:acyl carrier protein [Amycolatopsis rifamycinica]|uniref:Carrier domain-containing protein n=1 Tax=Amycolatopsis rifamycinica TaxID=287986 RepID=A0A066UEN4_9PSEU|nr:acyl carrier protein [Amycolatopsis rifamycinica]KDN22653.1 hypothetical protein DV20_08025 [Amycolatopsis rifamycinica]
MTLAEFVDVIRACAGDPDEYDLNGDILDVPFEELGYDSLALIEVSARLKQDHGVDVDGFAELASPRAALELINGAREREVA